MYPENTHLVPKHRQSSQICSKEVNRWNSPEFGEESNEWHVIERYWNILNSGQRLFSFFIPQYGVMHMDILSVSVVLDNNFK